MIQARMSSSRLPGKVLLPLGGSTILGWVVSAAARAKTVDQVVVATSAEDSDDRVVAEARRLDVPVVRGPLTDVLDRYPRRSQGSSERNRRTPDRRLSVPRSEGD